VFVLTILANLHLPLPSEVFLPFAGFLGGQGRFSVAFVLAASTAGGVTAALVHYFPGLRIGEERLRQLFRRIENTNSFLWRMWTGRARRQRKL